MDQTRSADGRAAEREKVAPGHTFLFVFETEAGLAPTTGLFSGLPAGVGVAASTAALVAAASAASAASSLSAISGGVAAPPLPMPPSLPPLDDEKSADDFLEYLFSCLFVPFF